MTNLRIAIEEIEASLPDNVEIHVDLVVYDTEGDDLRQDIDNVNAILSKHRAGSLDTKDIQDALDGYRHNDEVDGSHARVAIELN